MSEKSTQYIFLAAGLVMAVIGGAVKAMAVAREPDIFFRVFFSGPDYILLMVGLLLVVLAMGGDRLFGPDGPEGPEEQR